MNLDPRDRTLLREAIDLALRSVEAGGGPFGAVIARHGEIVGRGHNRVTLEPDPTAHAEVQAIRDACRRLDDFSLHGCVLYASCEPCPLCLAAIYWARIDRVVYAASAREAAAAGFDDTRIARELCLPPAQRRLPMQHCPGEGHDEAFRRWLAKADRTPY